MKKKWNCFGRVVGSKYFGIVEAETEDEAQEKAEKLDSCYVSICHRCSEHIDDAQIDEIVVELDE